SAAEFRKPRPARRLPSPDEVHQRLRQYGQEHVLAWWDQLDDSQRGRLLDDVWSLDLEQLRELYRRRDETYTPPSAERIAPVPVVRLAADDRGARRLGEEALRRGEVAVLLVAGGQGSRLGFDKPKGMFPVSPVTQKSLFRVHAEKVLALQRRFGRPVPFLVMTSPATHVNTEAFFAEHRYFGLPKDEVTFFRQGTMPALDMATGKLLLAGPGELFLSPNGHGGTLTALADSGL